MRGANAPPRKSQASSCPHNSGQILQNIKELLVAAHVRDKKADGSDDERNGLILCWNHHTAFDSYLFGIDPKNLKIIPQNNHVKLSSLGITVNVLTPEKEPPHPKALEWKWKKFKNFGSK